MVSIPMFDNELIKLQQQHLLRRCTVIEPHVGPRIAINGKIMLLLCSNDYLGLANHPALRIAASAAMERHGFGSGASRLVSGTRALHQVLEHNIAEFKGTEAALLFNSGYAANTGIIPAITGKDDVILSDALNHASIIDGCRLSSARAIVYRHKDTSHVETLLREHAHARRKLIVTDGVFSMDGDIAPLPDLVELAAKYNAVLMVDDAHAVGVLGPTGRGTAEHFGLSDGIHIHVGTFGKSLGSFGAYAAGTQSMIMFLLNHARSFIFSTALPPAVCAASISGLEVLTEHTELLQTLRTNQKRFVTGLNTLGIDTGGSETAIIPIMIGNEAAAVKTADRLFEMGIYASAIRPPAVPSGAARIRTTMTAAFSETDIDQALDAFRCLKREGYL